MKTTFRGRRQLACLGRILASNIVRPPQPLKISYAVTYRCNLRCAMCNIWKKDKGLLAQELSVAQAAEFFGKAGRPCWLGVTGGEPFLREDLPELVEAALRSCKTLGAVHFATNGTLPARTLRTLEYLHGRFPRQGCVVTVSVDGPPELHDSIRGVPGTWSKALETFLAVKALPFVKAQIGFTITHRNLGAFVSTFTALKRAVPGLTFDDINVNVFQRSASYFENADMEPLDANAILTELSVLRGLDLGGTTLLGFLRRTYLRRYADFLKEGRGPLKCQALSTTCFLDPYGNIYPCSAYARALGNVRKMESSLEEMWMSPSARRLASDCSHRRCPGCWNSCEVYSAIGGSLLQAVLP